MAKRIMWSLVAAVLMITMFVCCLATFAERSSPGRQPGATPSTGWPMFGPSPTPFAMLTIEGEQVRVINLEEGSFKGVPGVTVDYVWGDGHTGYKVIMSKDYTKERLVEEIAKEIRAAHSREVNTERLRQELGR